MEQPEVGRRIYTVGNYDVLITKFKDPVLDEEIFGYGVFNTVTGVQEAECRRSWTARLIAITFDKDDNTPVVIENQEESGLSKARMN